MCIIGIKYMLVATCMLVATNVFAQKEERDYIRKGNRFFKDSVFVDADVNYRKALEINPKSTVSMYNLGNTLSNQQKPKEAMEQYVAASRIEKDKSKLAQIYHNMGVLLHTGKDYAKAVEAYKMSLRNNPADNETRYNLALAQKMLKDQQNQQQNQQNQDKKQDQQKDQQKNKDKNKQNEQKQDKKQDQQPPKSEKKDNQMSKENAEQLLNTVMQDEKNVQDKVKKQQKIIQRGRLEKDW